MSKHGEIEDGSQRLVRDIRAKHVAFEVLAGGRSAEFVDFKSSLARHLEIALAIIALATFTILFLMTGSVVLPLKALVMNVLTLSATSACWCSYSRTDGSRACSTTRARSSASARQVPGSQRLQLRHGVDVLPAAQVVAGHLAGLDAAQEVPRAPVAAHVP